MSSRGIKGRRIGAGVTLAALGLVAVGCGGGGESSATQAEAVPLARVVAKADAICVEGNRRMSKLQVPPFDPARATPAQLRVAAPYLREVTAIVADEVEGAAAAGTPDEKAAELATAIEDSRRLVDTMRQEASAAAAGDREAFRKAGKEAESSPSGRELAALGFKVCGQT